VKRMNSAGDDITVRNGFFIPAGEINFMPGMKNATSEFITGPSSLVDVAIGPNGMWSVLDQKRSRIYTYDAEGNLLFAFGDIGHQLGNLSQPTAMTYFGADLYVLDSGITIYKRTEYGDVIDNALYYNRIRNYSSALENWQEILKRNNNFDAAYVGVGKNLYSQGHYAEAMEFFKTANDTENYSEAFKALRREWVGKYFLVVVAVIVVVLVLVVKGLSYVGKVNKAGDTKVGKRTFKEELLYAFYVMVHPFDGFWDLKHEKCGSVRAAIAVLVLAAASLAYKNVGSGYLYSATTSGKGTSVGSVFTGIASVAIPLLLWCIANWCLTTLFDGEGTLKDIFITSCYSLMPIPVLIIPTTIASNFLTLDPAENNFVTLLTGLALVWVGLLLFFGIMTTHGYSMGLNIGMTILTIVAMLFIVFLCMLFTNLITRMVSFITDIVLEISYRSY
ncbi:MAG: YIP1 family protein, partial [Ruminococcus sp.]|nr:YIP1 family protein [Candidatus Apopatosoma intestinale]